MPNICIFDFDGTIADSIPSSINILKKLALINYNKKIDDNLIKELRDKTIPEVFKALNISLLKLPFIAHRARIELNKEVARLKPINGIKKLLQDLIKQGHILCIVSSNSKESIEKFLEKNNLLFFDAVITSSPVFGKSNSISRLLKQHGWKKSNTFYIGDEIRDVEAAKKAGIKMISVTWGVNSRSRLSSENPDFLVENPSEISELLSTKNK